MTLLSIIANKFGCIIEPAFRAQDFDGDDDAADADADDRGLVLVTSFLAR